MNNVLTIIKIVILVNERTIKQCDVLIADDISSSFIQNTPLRPVMDRPFLPYAIFCYLLYSTKLGRYYTGATEEPLEIRISKRNHQSYGNNHFTAKSDDWQLFDCVQCEPMLQALRLERHIKKMKDRKYLHNLKKYPQIAVRGSY